VNSARGKLRSARNGLVSILTKPISVPRVPPFVDGVLFGIIVTDALFHYFPRAASSSLLRDAVVVLFCLIQSSRHRAHRNEPALPKAQPLLHRVTSAGAPDLQHAGWPAKGIGRTVRRLFTPAAVISLLLCLTTIVFWVRSCWKSEFVIWSHVKVRIETGFSKFDVYDSIDAGDGNGCFVVGYGEVRSDASASLPTWRYQPKVPPVNYHALFGPLWEQLGFYWGTGPDGLTDIAVPCWFIAGILAVLPAAWGIRRLRRPPAVEPGHCAVCGYDLRASEARCSECGTPIPLEMNA
jgi:hypothetical protein